LITFNQRRTEHHSSSTPHIIHHLTKRCKVNGRGEHASERRIAFTIMLPHTLVVIFPYRSMKLLQGDIVAQHKFFHYLFKQTAVFVEQLCVLKWVLKLLFWVLK
jgi:hypothetical protein